MTLASYHPQVGGAASSANQSLAVYSPSLTAEGAVRQGSPDLSSFPFPPFSLLLSDVRSGARAEAQPDSFPMDILTQDWLDFLDSSQTGEARNFPAARWPTFRLDRGLLWPQ
jgi:hypothetical protein